jgi:hypothetical protein
MSTSNLVSAADTSLTCRLRLSHRFAHYRQKPRSVYIAPTALLNFNTQVSDCFSEATNFVLMHMQVFFATAQTKIGKLITVRFMTHQLRLLIMVDACLSRLLFKVF